MSDDFTGADFAPSGGDTGSSETSAPAASTAQPGAATTQPAVDPASPITPAVQTSEPGPIPFAVHKTALENARTKANDEYRAKYGWAEQVSPDEYQQVRSLAQRLSGPNAVQAVSEIIAEMNANPVHAQALRSLAAKALAAGRGQATPTMPEPDVVITDAQGNVVGATYSDKAMAQRDAFMAQRFMAMVDEKYAPVVKTHEQVSAERAQLQKEAAATQFVTGLQKELTQYPGFTEHKQAIGQEVARMLAQYPANDPKTDEPAFLEALTLRAYTRVVVPKLQTDGRQTALRELTHQANASTVNPAKTGTPAQKTYDEMSIAEALEYESKRTGVAIG